MLNVQRYILTLCIIFNASRSLIPMTTALYNENIRAFNAHLSSGRDTRPILLYAFQDGSLPYVLDQINDRGYTPLDIAVWNNDIQNISNITFYAGLYPKIGRAHV